VISPTGSTGRHPPYSLLEAAMTETTPVPHHNLSIDQQLALRTAATHLSREFDGTFGQETIERFLHTSYDQFAGRSQMAMGFFQHLAGEGAVAWSGGSEPGDEVNPAAIAAMSERGIDISREFTKPWTEEIVRAADVRPIRDDIERRVRGLLDELGVPAQR
jgi:hypothetical protein